MKQNENGEYMVEHHTHYKEIHGTDRTVWITQSEHKKIHMQLRREDKCNIPSDKLNDIAMAAHGRTRKRMEYAKNYQKNNTKSIQFSDILGNNAIFQEIIRYNYKTGSIVYTAGFYGYNNHKLPIIEIKRA